MPQTAPREPAAGRDWFRRPIPALLWWGLPFAAAEGSSFWRPSVREAAWIWSGAMAVMGVGCMLNAARCRRLHCLVSAPALLLGAASEAAIALFNPWRAFAVGYVTWAVAAVVAAAFIPELLGRRYI